jgi:sensor histidine kinase YesM
MEKRLGFGDRIAASVVGLAFFIVGMSFMLLGVTFLPVIGVVCAIPLMGISLSFFHTQLPKARLEGRVQSRAHTAGHHGLAT